MTRELPAPAHREVVGVPQPPLLARVLLSLAVLVAATVAVLMSSPTLGLDLRGGTRIVLEAQDSPTMTADAEVTDRALDVLRRRVDALGVAEPTLGRAGEQRIVVELTGLTEPREAVEVIGRTAQPAFDPVLDVATPGEESTEADDTNPAETVSAAGSSPWTPPAPATLQSGLRAMWSARFTCGPRRRQ